MLEFAKTKFRGIYQNIQIMLSDREQIIKWVTKAGVVLVSFVGLYVAGRYLPEGFDWRYFFSIGRYPSFWMPWTRSIVQILNLPLIFAITVLAMGLRSYKYSPSPLALFLAFISLPTLWVFYLGNLDGLVLLGLIALPVGAPLVLIKPQVASFALLARKNSIYFTIIWILISFMIWGFWPTNFSTLFSPEWKQEWVQDITLFPWGVLIAIPMMWFSRGDEDLLMASGSLGTPHLFPYHFIVLMPALARMRWYWMVITWAISWTPFLSNWLGPMAWHFGNLMSVCFWFGIYLNRQAVGDEPFGESDSKFTISKVFDWTSNLKQ